MRSVTELAEVGLVQSATAEIRPQPASALFKLYLINGHEAFQGFDPLSEHPVNIDGSSNTDGEPMVLSLAQIESNQVVAWLTNWDPTASGSSVAS